MWIFASVYLIQVHLILDQQRLLSMVSRFGNTSFPFSIMNNKHKHTQTLQYVVWRCGAAAGSNQEEKKRKQREKGRQRGLLYTLTHVGFPALIKLPKHMTQLWHQNSHCIAPSSYVFKIPYHQPVNNATTQTHTHTHKQTQTFLYNLGGKCFDNRIKCQTLDFKTASVCKHTPRQQKKK